MLEKLITFMITGREDDKGATATEYGLLVGLIALIIVIGVGLFGNSLNTFFAGLATSVGSWN
ncbi:Flp family type IVb pilin [Nocardioides sp. P5_E3]